MKAGIVARHQLGEGGARALAAFVKAPASCCAQIGAMFILRKGWEERQRENICRILASKEELLPFRPRDRRTFPRPRRAPAIPHPVTHRLCSAISMVAMLTPSDHVPARNRSLRRERRRGRARAPGQGPRRQRARTAIGGRPPPQGRAGAGTRRGRAPADQGPARPALRRAACASCRTRSSACCTSSRPSTSIPRRIRRRPSTWRSSPPAAMAAACWRRAPTSICCSCCPTSRPPGANPSPRRSSIACGTWGSRSATPRARSTSASARPRPT